MVAKALSFRSSWSQTILSIYFFLFLSHIPSISSQFLPQTDNSNPFLLSCYQNTSPYRDILTLRHISGRFLPLLSSHNLDIQNNNITNIIILIHGYRENITTAFCSGLNSVINRNIHDHVAIISPYFYHKKMTNYEWIGIRNSNNKNLNTSTSNPTSTPPLESLYWRKNASWISGSDSSDIELSYTSHSSFDMLDDLYLIITQRNLFPSLKRVTFIGFSAGGQLLNRYAFATLLNTPLDPKYYERLQIPIRYLISNPSSWLYFNNYRPSFSSCLQPYDTGPYHQCINFTKITSLMKLNCKEIDEWRYGLNSFGNENQKDEYKYLRAIWTNESLMKHISWYFQKDIRYILGSYDSCNCKSEGYVNPSHCYLQSTRKCSSNSKKSVSSSTSSTSSSNSSNLISFTSCCQDTYPDSFDNDLSTTCGSQAQGMNRLQRGLNYISYLQFYLNTSSTSLANSSSISVSLSSSSSSSSSSYPSIQYSIIPSLQHDMPSFLSSDIVYQWGYLLGSSTPTSDILISKDHFYYTPFWWIIGSILILFIVLGLIYHRYLKKRVRQEYNLIPDLVI